MKADASDIAALRAADAVLRESGQRYRTIFDNVSDLLYLLEVTADVRFRFAEINPAVEKLMGLPREEIVGKYVEEVIPRAEAQGVIARLRRCFTAGAVIEEDVELDLPTGYYAFIATIVPVRDESVGRICHIASIARDITVRKRAEELLQASEQKFRTLTESSPDIIVCYDRDCRRTYVNPAHEKASGISAEQALNAKPGAGGRAYKSGVKFKAILRKVMDTGNPAENCFRWAGSDGRPVDYIFHIVAERDREGRVVGALSVGRNVTGLKETERRIEESQAQLRKLIAQRETAREEERKHIARELHDELGQFLTALRMNVSLLRVQFGKDNPVLMSHLRNMTELVDRNIQVVRNVTSALRPVALDMGVASALEWLVEEFSRNTGIPCELHAIENEIALDEDAGMAVFRMVQESLTNVARHAKAKRVTVALRRKRNHYQLEVCDDGRGFAPDRVGKKSLGLVGLRERALMLGGEVSISSAPGQGTALEVRIPFGEMQGRK